MAAAWRIMDNINRNDVQVFLILFLPLGRASNCTQCSSKAVLLKMGAFPFLLNKAVYFLGKSREIDMIIV